MAAGTQPVRRRAVDGSRSAASCSSASSSSSCWCRSTGCSTPRSSRATTISPSRRCGVPSEPTWSTTTAALFAYRGLDGLINSLIISISATVLSALFGTLMAYSLARYNTGGQHLSFWVLSQRFLPPIAIVLPIFLIYRGIGI